MWLNSTSQYAIRAVLYVAEHDGHGPVRVEDVATGLACPRNYLSKTLHGLVQAGVLRSTRGPKGGFRLADRPERLVLARVIAPFEPVAARRCLVGRPDCGGAHPCLAHHRWKDIAEAVGDFFEHTSVADLLAGASPGLPLSRPASRPRSSHRVRPTHRTSRHTAPPERRKPHGSTTQ